MSHAFYIHLVFSDLTSMEAALGPKEKSFLRSFIHDVLRELFDILHHMLSTKSHSKMKIRACRACR